MTHLGGNDRPGTVETAESTIENMISGYSDTSQSKQMDWPAIRIPEVVARSTGKSATELPPLQEAIDGDALNTLVKTGSRDAPVRLTFEWAECTVTVASAETVEVTVEPHS